MNKARLILIKDAGSNHFDFRYSFILLSPMRILLFIPVLVLFLSNVPFVQRIPLETALLMMADKKDCNSGTECRRSTENLKANCASEQSDCDPSCDTEATAGDNAATQCQQPETECVCICCFQYAAPLHPLISYVFHFLLPESDSEFFVVGHIKDPHVAAPWQPPDLA